MSYKYETQHNSPNYTRGADAQRTWGQPFSVRAIAIHWWGDPNQNPTYEGVISTLVNPSRGASAHFVATGTGRRVAQLIDLDNASWATNSANPWTVSIECDPRCRNEDYDVVAELIAQIRQVFGSDLPLVPHQQFVATACPGNYDLARLDREAKNKVAKPEFDWGHVENRVQAPVKQTVPGFTKLSENYVWLRAKLDKVELWDLESNPNYVSKKTFNKGDIIKVGWFISMNDTQYYVTDSSHDAGRKWGINRRDVDVLFEDPNKPVVVPPKPEPEKPVEQPERPSEVSLDESSTTLLQDVKKLLQELIQLLKGIFKTGDK